MVKLHGVFGGVALAEGGVQEDSKSRPKLCLLLQILRYFRKIVFLFSVNQKMYPTFHDPLEATLLGSLENCAVLIHVQDNNPPPCLPHLGEESLVHQLVSQTTSSLTSY